MPRRVLVILLLSIVLNFFYAAVAVHLLRRRRPFFRLVAVLVGLWSVLAVVTLLPRFFEREDLKAFLREWFYFPMATGMVWNLLFLQFVVLGTILYAIILGRARPATKLAAPTPQELSRRRFLYLLSFGSVPAVSTALGVHGTLTRYDLRVRDYVLRLPQLPPEWDGFTIAHLSDLHSGIYCGPKRLGIIRDAANDLKADLVAVTGDLINESMGEFPAALDCVRRLESRHGTWLCIGNHDLIPGYGLMARACAENGLRLLVNTTTLIAVEGRRLILAGMPWFGGPLYNGRPLDVARYWNGERQPGDFRLLMVHHPRHFDQAGSADLVLSGHTHGGQIMLGRDVGLGPLFFKYWSGLYQRDSTSMIVSNGCGDWFPCRVGAPAEIGRIRLAAA